PESNLQLTERERALIEKWIDQGAEWKQYWAFIPPAMPASLATKEEDESAIDFLVNKKIKEYGLEISPEANKNTLVRRVSYLLTGLPPTTGEIQSFLDDKSGNAYEKMVDHYLASNRYGERWARHWMDLVRYAETKGHEFDYTISGAWRYRDYLIRAFNKDLPYNQLVQEHIAGDLIPARVDPSTGEDESRVATAFYAMTEGTHSPVDIEQDEADRIDNMIDVTSKTFQALTVSCARCHDHKFDPITTKDYYSMFGIMRSTRFSPVPANLGSETKKILAFRNAKDSVRKMIASEWQTQIAQAKSTSINGSRKPVSNDSIIVIGDFRNGNLQQWKSDGMAFDNRTTLGEPVFNTTHALVHLQDGKASSRILGTGIFGALRSPDFIINTNNIGVRALGKHASIRIIMSNFQLISFPIYGNMDQHLDTSKWVDLTFDVSQWKGQKAYIEVLPGYNETHVFKMPPDAFVEIQYAIGFNNKWIEPALAVSPSKDLREIVRDWSEYKSSASDIEALNSLIRSSRLSRKIPAAGLVAQQYKNFMYSRVDSSEFINAVYDGEGADNAVYIRGSHKDRSAELVPRAFLSALNSKKEVYNVKGSGRRELAASIVNASNPLTARVMVNRIWQHLFGKGIVETVDNFGMQGKLPSNPDLLDYLAIQFIKDQYSIKNTIRSILLTETFKRAVMPAESSRKSDPTNTYLSHFPVQRLEAEAIRDALLAAAGTLDSSMYGPPVPVHITSFMNGRGKPEASGPLDGKSRRSIYQEVRRNFLDPLMTTFDRPIPFTSFGKRTVTNVPSQSLILLNDPFVLLEAEAMAKKLSLQKGLSFDNKIQWIYDRAFSRPANATELEAARQLIAKLGKLNGVKESPELSQVVWKDYIHSVFNLKEFIYLM
ncbi:MAG TPA: DUF1549 and DUF1553 domain-containing protein, partial [Flavitalea sp.]|nr:DUF1549 and DUF1553 domain-containing protein [Flavitalea sp.]